MATRPAQAPGPGEPDLELRVLAGDVWRSMAEFTWSRVQGGRAMHALKGLGLAPGHLKVLGLLEPGEALPMGTIAEHLSIDPSMATWLIDRLEERKLVDRTMLASDRRVKVVSLTRRGERVKTKVFAELFEPPTELVELAHLAGMDGVDLDGEQGHFDLSEIDEICRVANAAGMTVTARVPSG